MTSKTSSRFWKAYYDLPEQIQERAKKQYKLWRNDPWHSSLYFKRIGTHDYWSVRVTDDYRAYGVRVDNSTIIWFWIGTHPDYEKLMRRL